ncbi:MAG: hypothetical protein ABEJ82_02375 [Haloplanus sp.]
MSVTDHLPDRPLTRDEFRELAESERVENATVLEEAGDGDLILAFALAVGGHAHPCRYLSARGEWECGREALAPPGFAGEFRARKRPPCCPENPHPLAGGRGPGVPAPGHGTNPMGPDSTPIFTGHSESVPRFRGFSAT